MRKIIAWITVMLWMVLIFYFSHQPATASNNLSIGITDLIVENVEKVAPNLDFSINNFNHLVRKNAHFIIYFTLGILVVYALRRSGVLGYRSIGLGFLFCVLYAISDEVHQLFVSGRGGQVMDVLIDSAGASFGIGLYWMIGAILNRASVELSSEEMDLN